MTSAQGVTVVFGNENWSTNLTGTDNDYLKAGNWTLAAGRRFLDSELRSGAAVCILGASVRKELFGAQDPVGSKVRLKKFACRVIGLLEAKGQSTMGTDRDDLILTPLRTFWRYASSAITLTLSSTNSTSHSTKFCRPPGTSATARCAALRKK